MSEVSQKQVAGLKNLLATLREVNSILAAPEDQLDYLATNSPQDKTTGDQSNPSGEAATLDALISITNQIQRKANHIAKSTNIIIGS